MTALCSFRQEYYDLKIQRFETFQCDQEACENKDVCLFHDDAYLKDNNHPENKDKVIQKLYDRIYDSLFYNKPLFCIGYFLPDIRINKKFTQSVNFNYCKFQIAKFSRATF